MYSLLQFKKRVKGISSNKKGFSSIVGALFAAIIIISLFSGIFLWSINQNNLYNNAVSAKNQLQTEQLSENLRGYGANYTLASAGNTNVLAAIQNQGGLSVRFIRLWIRDNNNGLYNSKIVNYNLVPGDIKYISEDISLNFDPTHNFSSWFVTERGNVASTMEDGGGPPGPSGPLGPEGREGPPALNAMTAQGIGSVAMDFNSFKYYRVNSSSWPSKLLSYPAGQMGYSAPCGNNIYGAFAVNITNYDMHQRDLLFTNMTMLWVLFPVLGTQPRSSWWYVVNIDSSGNIQRNFTPIALTFNQTKTLIFASLNPMVATYSFAGVEVASGFAGPAVANLMIVGNAGTQPLGNNIPFVAIQFS